MQYVSMKSKKQSGLVVILFTLSLVILLGFAALAVDLSHLVLNKSRVQNGVDSAALSASVAIENGGGLSDAAKAAIETIELMASSSGNDELNISSQNITPSEVSGAQGAQYQATYTDGTYIDIFFSNDPTEFSNQSVNLGRDIYTRVSVDNHTLDSFLIQIFGLSKSVSASAVSGRSSTLVTTSNIAPIGVCDGSSDSSNPTAPWGYEVGTVYQIAGKTDDNSGGSDKDKDKDTESDPGSGDIGPGNFNYLSLDGFSSGNNYNGLKGAMAGNPPPYSFTEDAPGIYYVGRKVETKPGANNSISEGVNSRFDDTSGYPDGDTVKDDFITYDDYRSRTNPAGNGRRMLTVPVLDCASEEKISGRDLVPIVGFACFFITNRYVQGGNSENKKIVFGEFFTEGCTVQNGSGGLNSSDTGPYKIQLYRDPYRGDA
ncbi:TadE/TadG family type IV pilus assembly protein [Vibrio breoganii]|nr:TadE/TadG family type IV pilus assembly protein [Vibrio breoganii]PMI17892.1 hypothetical protein BCU49_13025 [Vibrio breoganii]